MNLTTKLLFKALILEYVLAFISVFIGIIVTGADSFSDFSAILFHLAIPVLVGFLFSATIILLISVGIYVVLMTPRTSFFITVAISYIGVCIYERTVVVYICRCVGTSMRISASLNTTIIARFKVLLQYNVNDTS